MVQNRELLTKRWSTADLPILPFLAPRVFRPWPCSSRRSHSSRNETTARDDYIDHDNFSAGSDGDQSPGEVLVADRGFDTRGQQLSAQESCKVHECWQQRKVRKPVKTRGIFEEALYRRFVHEENQKRVRNRVRKAMRAKMVPLDLSARDTEGILTFWNKSIAILKLRYRYRSKTSPPPKLIHERRQSPSPELLEYLVDLPVEAFRREWQALSEDLRISLWPYLMLLTIERYPTKALKVLENTYSAPFPPSYAVSDALDCIISFYLDGNKKGYRTTNPSIASKLQHVILELLRSGPSGHLQLSQKSIYLLLSNLSDKALEKFYANLVSEDQALHPNTLAHFSSCFVKSDKVDLAFEVLSEMVEKGVDLNMPQYTSLCTSLLCKPADGIKCRTTEIARFQFMLAHGLSPNVTTYNVLIKNAINAEDPMTGWQLHDLMLDNGLEPDSFTYSLLLNDAKLRVDSNDINTTMGYLRSTRIISNHLVTDILHSILIIHQLEDKRAESQGQKSGQRRVFKRMLDVYCQHYKLDALAHFVPNLKDWWESSSDVTLESSTFESRPTTPTIIVMLSGLLSDLDSRVTKSLYDNIYQLLISGDREAEKVMSTTYMWNILLHALGKHQNLVEECPKLLGTMLSLGSKSSTPTKHATSGASSTPGPVVHNTPQVVTSTKELSRPQESSNDRLIVDVGSATMFNSKTSEPQTDTLASESRTRPSAFPIRRIDPFASPPFSCPSPDVYTWSILLGIFTKHKQPRAAEKVLKAMCQRGIEPNNVTWNTLVSGYSQLQDPDMAAASVARMEKAGFEVGPFTMSTLGKIRDSRRLDEALKRAATKEFGQMQSLRTSDLDAVD